VVRRQVDGVVQEEILRRLRVDAALRQERGVAVPDRVEVGRPRSAWYARKSDVSRNTRSAASPPASATRALRAADKSAAIIL
jgi:hypothetical protein